MHGVSELHVWGVKGGGDQVVEVHGAGGYWPELDEECGDRWGPTGACQRCMRVSRTANENASLCFQCCKHHEKISIDSSPIS